jgi:coenzyme F420-reducing hydrogenase delta subunit
VRCFPLSCSGRLEQIHILKALEEFSDAVYLVACPEGACRYFEGNTRARKRVEYTQRLLAEIGLEQDRAGIIVTQNGSRPLVEHIEVLKERASLLGPLSLHPDR